MNTIKFLRIALCAEFLTIALIIVLFETNVIEPGMLAGDDLANYWMSIVGVAMVIVTIPLALRLMKNKRIKESVAKSEENYLRWSLIRIALLEAPLIYNILCYYLLGCEPTFGYMALMTAVAFIFVWPSKDKMAYEREVEYSQDEQ